MLDLPVIYLTFYNFILLMKDIYDLKINPFISPNIYLYTKEYCNILNF